MMRRAFTLVEMLVVVTIICILAALLFPVYSKARDQVRQVGCVSNLRQIGFALRMYLSDNDGGFPIGAYDRNPTDRLPWDWTWHDSLLVYGKDTSFLYCPMVSLKHSIRRSYGVNPWLSSWCGSAMETSLRNPSRTVYVAEHETADWASFPPSYVKWRRLPNAEGYRSVRHSGKTLVLFVEGNIRPFDPDVLEEPAVQWQVSVD